MTELSPLGLTINAMSMASGACAGLAIYPLFYALWEMSSHRVERYQQSKVEEATKALEDIFIDIKPKWLNMAYGIGPVVVGPVVFAASNSLLIALAGAVVGLVLPDFLVKQSQAARRRKFQSQLVDALFILSSSLRAGLSLTQAFEQLETEMGPPASQEFGLMIKAHRLGRTLEESLQGLNERMPCEELNLITTAVLVARETGGDVTNVISQLVTTIREKKKLNDKVKTLTLQGRLQAYIMSVLPVLFAISVHSFKPNYFEVLLNDPIGQFLLAVGGGLWLVGMTLLLKMSRVDV